MSNNRKKVAAISAVISYLKQEEEAISIQQSDSLNGMWTAVTPRMASNFWGVSGRQAQMQMRGLMQMKALYRLK